MKAIIQRVSLAQVIVKKKVISQIGPGFLVLLGISQNDTKDKAEWLAEKTVNLRIMADKDEKMNLSLKDVSGEMLVVSQFTLYGDCQKGNRPSFIKAAKPEKAQQLYNLFLAKVGSLGIKVQSGIFGARMKVKLVNDGPVTLIVNS